MPNVVDCCVGLCLSTFKNKRFLGIVSDFYDILLLYDAVVTVLMFLFYWSYEKLVDKE